MKVCFDDVVEDITRFGRKISSDKFQNHGEYPIIDQGQQFVAGYLNESQGLLEDFPVIIFGDHTRILKYVDFPFFLGADGVKVLKVKNNNFLDKYVYYNLCAIKIPDTGYNRHFKWLKQVELKYYSLEDQQNIIDKLDKITWLIEKRKQQLEKLDLLIKSKFIEMFGETDSPKYSIYKLKDIAKYHQGTQVAVELQSNIQKDNMVRFLRIIDYTQPPQEPRYVKVKGYEVYKDSVVIVRYGASAGFVGKGYDGILANNLFEVIPNTNLITKEFLYSSLKYGAFENEISNKVMGAAMPAISFGLMDSIQIIIPPIEHQYMFEKFVEQTDKTKFTIKQSLEKLQTLKNALMQKYFG